MNTIYRDIENDYVVECIIEDYIYTVSAWPQFELTYTERCARRVVLICYARVEGGLGLTKKMKEAMRVAHKFLASLGDF